MAFPFSASFERSIKTVVTPENKDQLLAYIKKDILERKADNIVVGDMTVSYKGTTSNWNGALFRGVDNGTFSLVCKDSGWALNYQISTRSLFLFTSIMSSGMEVFVLLGHGPWWIGIIMFLWLWGMNWIIIMIRHGSLPIDLAAGIDHLSGAAPEEPEEDKMTGPLKSWF